MTFIEFCTAHGIIIDRAPRLGTWERYPTTTHPKKRNGAVKWMGDFGFLQDHAVHTEVIFWRSDKPVKIDPRVAHEAISHAEAERKKLQENAAMRASMIVNRCLIGMHPYFERKGFPKEKGLIWCHDQTEHLVIPMYENTKLVGLQTIDADGGKKFLYGQKTRGANFIIGRGKINVLCEGYATGLSVREAMRHLKHEWRIVVCFSAHNLGVLAKEMTPGLVVADHDASGTGERVAKATGWRYWISDTTGEDFNDYHRRCGLWGAAKSLWDLLYPARGGEGRRANSLLDVIRLRQGSAQGHASIKNG